MLSRSSVRRDAPTNFSAARACLRAATSASKESRSTVRDLIREEREGSKGERVRGNKVNKMMMMMMILMMVMRRTMRIRIGG